jgi:hypothetical protein
MTVAGVARYSRRLNGVDSKFSRVETVDDDGRIETRATTVIHDVEWLRKRHDRPALNVVAIVESTRETRGKS